MAVHFSSNHLLLFRTSTAVMALMMALGTSEAAIASECRTGTGGSGPNGGNTVANGGSCDIAGYNPRDNDETIGATLVTGGDTIRLVGSGTDAEFGNVGTQSQTLGSLTGGAGGPADQPQLTLGSKVIGVAAPDPATGTNISVATYDSSAFSQGNWLTAAATTPVNVGDDQYVNMQLGTAQSGTLIIDIGDPSQRPIDAANRIRLAAKQSILAQADAGGSVEWASRNTITMTAATAPAGITTVNRTISVPVFAGAFPGFDGQTAHVTDAASLAAYNDRLIAALADGRIRSQSAYDAAFARAVSFTNKTVSYTYTIDAGDDVTVPGGTNVAIAADGPGATGTIISGGQIDMASGTAMRATQGAVIHVENGARLSGYGTLMDIGTGSTGVNDGVISAGYLGGNNLDTNVATGDLLFAYYPGGLAVHVDGAGSTFTNQGIINLAGYTGGPSGSADYAVSLTNGAGATNHGIVNIGVNNNITGGSVTGAVVDGGSIFTNAADGLIYIGRSAQYTAAVPGVDTINAQAQYGVRLLDGQATNAGTIVIGGGTQNAVALMSVATSPTSSLINSGSIVINGAAGDVPLLNIGMAATNTNASVVRNDGSITLNGTNATGLKAMATGGNTALILDNGTISIAGGRDLVSGTRNFGVWAEGAGATIQLNGSILLYGEGAIGAHARNGGEIDLLAGASTTFGGGSDQIGYFAFGTDAKISGTSTGALTVATTNSTLFRIEDGAKFDVDRNNLMALGDGSTIINGSGAGVAIDVAGNTLNINGNGSTGLLLDGGAIGYLGTDTIVNLAGRGSTIAIIDGRKIQLDGSITGTQAPSMLTNTAHISSGGIASIGFVAQSGGQFLNDGTILLTGPSDNIGVIVRAGGALINNGQVTVQNGTGLLIQDRDSTASLSSGSSIEARNGVAAINVGNGATLSLGDQSGAIIADGTAHGILLSAGAAGFTDGATAIVATGGGNGIENRAETASIHLAATPITVNDGAGIRTATSLDPANLATVNVLGAGSGFAFARNDGTTLGGDLSLGDGYRIMASGAGAKGVVLATTGNASLAATVMVSNAAGGSALVGGPAASITNQGTLTSASTSAPTVDLSAGAKAFVNSGTLANIAGGPVLLGGAVAQSVTFAGGSVSGSVDLGGGDATFLMTGGTFTGSLTTGAGSDQAIFRGLSDANFGSLQTIDAGASMGDRDQLTFDATSGAQTGRLTNWNRIDLINGSNLQAVGDLILKGTAIFSIDATSTLQAGSGSATSIRSSGGSLTVLNAGTIDLTHPLTQGSSSAIGGRALAASSAEDRLTIQGNYVGSGGRLLLDATLASDGSASDLVTFDGARGGAAVSGTTKIIVTNLNGLGALTSGNGIRLIAGINGATTTAQSTKDGFVLVANNGHIDVGAFEYRLFPGDLRGQGEDWYLRSNLSGGSIEQTTYRPAAALFSALPSVLRNADLSMIATLHRRVGDDPDLVGQSGRAGRLWGRFFADHSTGRQIGTVSPSTRGNENGFQIGNDLFQLGSADNRHNIGLYAGRIHNDTSVRGFASGIQDTAVGSLSPTIIYAGLYWTYVDRSGFYIDTVLQRSWYRGRVKPLDMSRRKINGNGVAASIEAGYAVKADAHWSIEPQAQIVAQGISINNVDIPDATISQNPAGGYLTGRIGFRLKGKFPVPGNSSIRAYARTNLWHTFDATDRTVFSAPALTTTLPISSKVGSTTAEAGGGLAWQFPHLEIYSELVRFFSINEKAGEVRHSTSGSVGVRLNW